MNFNLWDISVMGIPLIIAVVLHEVAHAYVALKLGDLTAKSRGRITLNPIKHIDWFWTILFPTLLIFSGSPIVFGAAKPVPVDPRNFKNPKRGMLWVALAGPVTNFMIAAFCFVLLKFFNLNLMLEGSLWASAYVWFLNFLAYSILINIVLGLFNLLPIPPLDGGRIVTGLLPNSLAYQFMKIERFGFFIVAALIYYKIPNLVLNPVINFILNEITK